MTQDNNRSYPQSMSEHLITDHGFEDWFVRQRTSGELISTHDRDHGMFGSKHRVHKSEFALRDTYPRGNSTK